MVKGQQLNRASFSISTTDPSITFLHKFRKKICICLDLTMRNASSLTGPFFCLIYKFPNQCTIIYLLEILKNAGISVQLLIKVQNEINECKEIKNAHYFQQISSNLCILRRE